MEISQTQCSSRLFPPSFQDGFAFHGHQTLRVWLISGCAFGTKAKLLRLKFQHGFGATRANGRMLGILADIRFPMPAALAFLAVGFEN